MTVPLYGLGPKPAQDEIIRMAREAGFTDYYPERLTRFAALVAANEREACAKTLEEYDPKDSAVSGRGIMAMVIRGRTNENF